MDRPSTLAAAAGLAALLAAGCEPQVEAASYAGEPLYVVEGTVTPGLAASLPPVEAALLWQRGGAPAASDGLLAARAPVESSGPAAGTFTVVVYQPPPAEAYQTLAAGEPRLARATVAAVPFGLADAAVPALPTAPNPSYGVALGHWLVHLDRDVPAGSLTAWWLGKALPAGFHLVRVAEIPCLTPEELAACVASLVGLGVPEGSATDLASSASAYGFCLARFRVTPAPEAERVALTLGTSGPAPSGTCP